MPTITHAIFGGALAIVLMSWSKSSKRVFTPHLVILFALNSFIGPDIFNIARLYHDTPTVEVIHSFVHSIVGFWVVALGLAVIYYYLLNAKRKKAERTPFSSIYLVIGAAGLLHFTLDILDQAVRLFPLANVWIRLGDFHTGETYATGPLESVAPWFSTTELFIVGIAWMLVLIYALIRRGERDTYIVAGLFLACVMLLLFLFGSQLVRGENDIGWAAYGLLFWVAPIALCYIASIPADHPSVAVSFAHWKKRVSGK
ncbi:MAG: hypothetical protein ACTSU5_15905 [Promethearchaeota archaeon]